MKNPNIVLETNCTPRIPVIGFDSGLCEVGLILLWLSISIVSPLLSRSWKAIYVQL